MVERQLPKLNVAGSIPVSRSNCFSKLATHPKSCAPLVSRSQDSQNAFQSVSQLIGTQLSLNP